MIYADKRQLTVSLSDYKVILKAVVDVLECFDVSLKTWRNVLVNLSSVFRLRK